MNDKGSAKANPSGGTWLSLLLTAAAGVGAWVWLRGRTPPGDDGSDGEPSFGTITAVLNQ